MLKHLDFKRHLHFTIVITVVEEDRIIEAEVDKAAEEVVETEEAMVAK